MIIETSSGQLAFGVRHTVEVLETLNSAQATYLGHTKTVLALALLSDGRIASASTDGTVHVWDPPS